VCEKLPVRKKTRRARQKGQRQGRTEPLKPVRKKRAVKKDETK
jgi:hypothetical protein